MNIANASLVPGPGFHRSVSSTEASRFAEVRGVVPSYDFEVDLESLVQAAKGTADAIALFKDKDAADLVPNEGDVGHETVWSACDEFQERWDDGMNN